MSETRLTITSARLERRMQEAMVRRVTVITIAQRMQQMIEAMTTEASQAFESAVQAICDTHDYDLKGDFTVELDQKEHVIIIRQPDAEPVDLLTLARAANGTPPAA